MHTPAWYRNEETGLLRLFIRREPRRGKWKLTQRKVSNRPYVNINKIIA